MKLVKALTFCPSSLLKGMSSEYKEQNMDFGYFALRPENRHSFWAYYTYRFMALLCYTHLRKGIFTKWT